MVLSILRAHYGASGKSSLVHATTDPRLHSYSFIAIKINCVNPIATTGYLLYSLAGRISSQLYRSCIYPSKGEYSSLVPNFIVNTQGPTMGSELHHSRGNTGRDGRYHPFLSSPVYRSEQETFSSPRCSVLLLMGTQTEEYHCTLFIIGTRLALAHGCSLCPLPYKSPLQSGPKCLRICYLYAKVYIKQLKQTLQQE